MHFKPRCHSDNRGQDVRGVSLLIVIIILGSALLIISTSALIIGLGEREEGFIVGEGAEARALADGCMDEVFLRIRREPAWGLGGAIPFTAPNGSCTITVSDVGGSVRQIDSLATTGSYTSHIRSTYSVASIPPVILTWEERTD